MAALRTRSVPPLELGWAFLRLGITTYGGAASAAIADEVVRRRAWLTYDEFLTFRSLAMIAPGANSPNLAILIGRHLAGTTGAILAFCAATIPGILTLLLIGIAVLSAHSAIGGALRGCAAAAVGLAFANAIEMTARSSKGVVEIAIVAATFVGVVVFHVPLWITLAVFVPLAVALPPKGGR